MFNKTNCLGILVIVLVFGMTVVGCDNGDGNGNGGEEFPSTSGSITVNDIESQYNGKYAVIRSSSSTRPAGADYLLGCSGGDSSAVDGVIISDGSVTIPVYKINGRTASSYNGNDSGIRIYVEIQSTSAFLISTLFSSSSEVYTIFDVEFTNGIATISVWE
jgi:hypothetical protein